MLWLQIMISVKLVAKQTRNSHLAQLKKISRSDVHWIKCETRLPRGRCRTRWRVNNHWRVSVGMSQTCSFMAKVMQCRCKIGGVKCFLLEKMTELYKILTRSFCRTFYLWILSRIALNFDKIVFHLNKHISPFHLITYINVFVKFQNVPDKFVNYSEICLLKRIQREAQILNPWFSSTIK